MNKDQGKGVVKQVDGKVQKPGGEVKQVIRGNK